jgi:hypothetical protein
VRTSSGLRLLVLTIVLAGCGGSAVPSPSPESVATLAPSPSPVAATEQPTLAPTEDPVEPTEEPGPGATEPATASLWAQDPPTPMLMNSAVRVVAGELNVRAKPDTSARIMGSVSEGAILAIHGMPPVERDGYIWYLGTVVRKGGAIPTLPERPIPIGDNLAGYVAASSGSAAYLSQLDVRCPASVDLTNVVGMLPAERLECFDDRTIQFEGTYGCPGSCISHIFGEYEPNWLLNPNGLRLLWEEPDEGFPLNLRFPPSVPEPAEAQTGHVLRVSGHFRDTAASECAMAMDYWWDDGIDSHAVPDVVARLLCRQEFVVERYEDLGADPDWVG